MANYAVYPTDIAAGATPSNIVDFAQQQNPNWRRQYDPGEGMLLWPDPAAAPPSPWPAIAMNWIWGESGFAAPPALPVASSAPSATATSTIVG